MPVYRIHRMKEAPRQTFRWAAHTPGAAAVKPRDYDSNGEIDAASPYALWSQVNGTGEALRVGDLLEESSGVLRICKYVGFEEARWVVAEVRLGTEKLPFAAEAG